MGLKDLLPGGARAGTLQLAEGEQELLREVAAVHPGTLQSFAGDLVLTGSRLVFVPLESRKAPPVVSWRLAETETGPATGKRRKPKPSSPDVLAAVRAGRPATLMAPPTLVLTLGDGATWEIGILAGRRKANRSADNTAARDRAVQAIRGRLS
jgi:hypothetical protein